MKKICDSKKIWISIRSQQTIREITDKKLSEMLGVRERTLKSYDKTGAVNLRLGQLDSYCKKANTALSELLEAAEILK